MKILALILSILTVSSLQAFVPKKILGIDERTKVRDLFARPYSAIGQIGSFCTGSLIAPDIVITAAHCLQDTQNPYLLFSLGREGKDLPFGSVKWKKAIIPSRYKDHRDLNYDFAFIFLENPVDADYIPFSLENRFNPLSPITISGYPGDKENTMWKSSCLATAEAERFSYYCDTVGGMSGSPIFQRVGDNYHLVGVHTSGEAKINSGILLRDEISAYLNYGKRALETGDAFSEIYIAENPYLRHPIPANTDIELVNNCRDKLLITTFVKDRQGNLKQGLRLVSSGKTKLADKSYSDTFYYSIRSRRGDYSLYGNEKCSGKFVAPKCFVSRKLDLNLDKNIIESDCK